MIQSQETKAVLAIAPVSLNNATATAIAVDTLGWNDARIDFQVGSTTGAISVLKLQSCETSGGSYTDVTGSSFSTLPGATDDNKIWSWFLKINGRFGRFLKVVATENNTGTGVYGAQALLFNGVQSPNSASESGAGAILVV